jgi:hypothetical protein
MSAPTPAQRYLANCLHRAIPEAPERWTPGRYRCPVCSKTPNDKRLVVGYNDQTREAWFTCHGGCDRAALRSALGIRSYTMLRDPGSGAGATPTGEFTYVDEHGRALFKVARWVDPASQRYAIRADDGGWTWTEKGWKRPYVVYRADEVAEAISNDEVIYLCATEADADAARQHGGVGTAIPDPTKGGFRTEYCEALRGALVRIVAAKSDGDRQRAQRWADALSGHAAARPDVLEPAGNATVMTLREHLAARYALDDLTLLSPVGSAATVPPVPVEPPPLASEQRILDRFKVAVGKLGVVGEKTTAATAYLTLTSRLLDKQASLAVKGHSASGKSFTVEQTVRFFPREAVIVMTAMSQRALVYSTEEYAHRTLVVYEATALREGVEEDLTSYFIRSLLSEGRIEYPVTVRDKDGNFTTRTIIKEGPTNLVITTTKTEIHAENETRVLSITTDDSRDQTKRVFAALADETESGIDLDEWVQLQQWLATAEHRVTIPYAAALAALVPPVAVRLRRDFGTVLALIRAHAVLHQSNRKRDPAGRIIADLDDYEQVHGLVAGVVAEGVAATVSEAVRETVAAVQVLTTSDDPDKEPPYPDGVTAHHIAEVLRLDKSAARRRLLAAKDGGYVFNAEDQKGKPGRWKPGQPLPVAVVVLPPRHRIAAAVEVESPAQPTLPSSGGTVARESTGEGGQ